VEQQLGGFGPQQAGGLLQQGRTVLSTSGELVTVRVKS
jgi:hypothetical protein